MDCVDDMMDHAWAHLAKPTKPDCRFPSPPILDCSFMTTPLTPLVRQSSSDFVLIDPVVGPIVSDNEKKTDFVLLLERSPVSNRRSVRASKELSEEDKAALMQRIQGATESREFVMIHESPISKRRGLRSSKELSAEEQRELSISLSVEVASSSAVDETMDTANQTEMDEDELGVTVTPTAPPRKPSFRNGRRVSEPNPATPPSIQMPGEVRRSAEAPELRVPGNASTAPHSTRGAGAGSSGSSPLGKASAEPESPTSVTGQFFGDLLKHGGGNLLAGL